MLRKPNDVLYFAAVMYNPLFINDSDAIVEDLFGEFILKSETFDFSHTTYYEPEMGEGLKKYFAAFSPLREPAFLPQMKHTAIDRENSLARCGKRIINIDPGYLALEKVVVASTKNFTHRVYLSDGIFADLQLMRRRSAYVGLEWTYEDYLREEAQKFFIELSKMVGEK